MTKETTPGSPGFHEENIARHYGKKDPAQTILSALMASGERTQKERGQV